MYNKLESDNVIADVIKTSKEVAVRELAVNVPLELKESSIPYKVAVNKAYRKASIEANNANNAVLKKAIKRTTHK